ncbi:MAG: alanine--tRNA ligase [Candidatus Omnitrophica bacterium]|nr:alanine--tRNA ligase [Candidatus Omnitrophota bacterium]MDD5671813.1 alanine--tRNA ligase [Candidatus Omnitrophota bacterium]
MMNTNEIRQSYLDFFAARGHKIVSSDSLVPQNDPTLLFTGAGMNQFKEYFLGLKKDIRRATSSQKCLRTGDLDNVGRTAYHHSFFEMLGNFSFGDYFKEEAIRWAWEYLTEVLRIPKELLRISIHRTDEEALKIWRDKIKIREDWIHPMGDDSNFWPANAPQDGPNGPCGPCSEIYYDLLEGQGAAADANDITSRRFAEIWNLVFTQFDRRDAGKLEPLANKNIDTGMGLERLACVLQRKTNNYEIDLFQPIHEAVQKALRVADRTPFVPSLNAIADHVRAVVFAVADGVVPSNEGRGYVIRKLIRRSLWHAHQIVPGKHVEEPFLYRVVPSVILAMSKPYPELRDAEKSIEVTLKGEEERFLDTLETGLRILHQRLTDLKGKSRKSIPGDIVFELYDTYGFPDELTKAIAGEEGFEIDQRGFEDLMDKQRERAKQSTQIAAAIFVSTDLEKKLAGIPVTKFLGYEKLSGEGRVLLADIQGKQGVVVLDQTPFYGESGGQTGDRGWMEGGGFKAAVVDTQKKDKVAVHYIEIEQGAVKTGDRLTLRVDEDRRLSTMRNHTATHLLHAALRNTLGKQVRQLGSMVSPEKLRFDYSYGQALTAGEMKQIEDAVNREILRNVPVIKQEKPIAEAKQEGAIAFFGDKYEETVRVITVTGFSKELCGGTHCDQTGQIGSFLILSDSSVASGTRRIEALTGEGVLEYLRELRAQMSELSQELKTTPAQLADRVRKLKDSLKKMEKAQSEGQVSRVDVKKLAAEAIVAGKYHFAAYSAKDMEIAELRKLSDAMRSEAKQTVYFLAVASSDKIHFLLGVSHDLVKSDLDLRELMRKLEPLLGTSGGGRKDLVQGGGPNDGQLQNRWQAIVEAAEEYLRLKSQDPGPKT